MTATSTGGAGQWISTHKKQAATGGGALLVVLLALRARKKAGAGLPGTPAGAGTNGVGIAGLSGTPDTTLTDLQNTLQDQLNTALGQFQTNVNGQIAHIPAGPPGPPGAPGPPAHTGVPTPRPAVPQPYHPHPPAPAPRPATKPTKRPAPQRRPAPAPHVAYTVQGGDNLTSIARKYGMPLSTLESRNSQIHNFNLIRPGDKVNIR